MAEPRKPRASADDAPKVVRKTPVRTTRARARDLHSAAVAERAYFLSLSERGASPEENWLRAEQEQLAS
jgi:hypothetical protein